MTNNSMDGPDGSLDVGEIERKVRKHILLED